VVAHRLLVRRRLAEGDELDVDAVGQADEGVFGDAIGMLPARKANEAVLFGGGKGLFDGRSEMS
jgi:hypothetical protein